MNDEDADWRVYHLIPETAAVTREELCTRSGLSRGEVNASLERLERFCLIECSGESVRMLNFGEALIRNQFKYDNDLPYTIENGVIRAKKG